ncbi:hypothetical protein H6F88_01900 [Oculatella sp. FACHB-28]|uniref:hypothetical protein n=1 Tax=Oculatella sp. FACHB-28 TaxID=2692845 RepID=UPI00168323B9|nr:hypothetical protein [Oculatella sp. FACHB-28]MBD2054787.1 hypothetical protein [Oculatella sp. FACHB-28]
MLKTEPILSANRSECQLSILNDSNLTRSVKSDIFQLPDSVDLGECRYCGSHDLVVLPGSGPHAGRLDCSHCRRFVKWLRRDKFVQIQAIVKGEVQ